MLPLEGKRAVVTGAAGGIGAPVARLLRQAGARVTGIDRVACGDCDETQIVDLSDANELGSLAGRLAGNVPDILVNVAGIIRFGLHEDQTPEALALCYQVNLVVPAVLARTVAAPMRQRGSGQIVNIGSVLGAIPYPWFAAYSSSKAGLSALSQGLRRELIGSGVTVCHINPRAARTPFNTGDVARFLAVTGMRTDEPEWVAQRIVSAILTRRETVSIGLMERLYAVLNTIAPKLIDNGLASQIRRARAEFS
ncbi:short-chain dehydrogenase [Croceicoccus estronivorus]|uniref:SDR family NAD(P)-dependent oxidoreductase n=1 Tax=Croceicoccus estronivorus TaxID=1172626 RepID=UPI00082D9F01|nr:SDR family NAD(P)-dependent oxidoreductase [Croceicoccus estronivorus]OCC25562.1 short-chain dehydrogenase [Croceicoccus estronivorus]